jgi:hypothetical protein
MPLAVPVTIAFDRAIAPLVTKATRKLRKLLLENSLDGGANIHSQPILNRIKPGIETQQRKIRRVCNLVHGVISLAVPAAG